MAQVVDTETVIGGWLAGPVYRATGWVAVLGMLSYAIVGVPAAIIGPRLPYLLDVPPAIAMLGATALIARRAYRGVPATGPIRAIVLIVVVTTIAYLLLGGPMPPGGFLPWVTFWVPIVSAIVAFGWQGWPALLVGTGISVLHGAAHYWPRYGEWDLGVALRDFTLNEVIVVASCLAGAGLRRSMRRRAGTEADVRESVTLAEAAASAVHMHDYWAGVVHDHVLAVLMAGSRLRTGSIPPATTADARQALQRLTEPPTSMPCTLGELVEWITESAAVIVPEATVSESVRDRASTVPGEVAAAVLAAAEEGLRNIRRHARPAGAGVLVAATGHRLDVRIVDRGPGFDVGAIDAGRLGLQVAVAERMAAVGGAGQWRSEPGRGTEVRLTWSGLR